MYDNAHGENEMHRHTLSAGKQEAVVFHHGTPSEAMNVAWRAVGSGYEEKSSTTKATELMDARLQKIWTEPVDAPFPAEAVLVPTDRPHAAQTIIDAAHSGKPVVLFFPDGEEVVLTPRKPDAAH